MTIGDRIKAKRLEKGMTLEEVANILQVGRATIHKYENNIITTIPSNKIELIAKALGTTPAYLMGWEEKHAQMEQRSDLLSRIVIKAQRDPQFMSDLQAFFEMDEAKRRAVIALIK